MKDNSAVNGDRDPLVSVVIPCYNAAPFLRETLDSVLNQTRPILEVIVVDDGSTDDSAAIADSYGPPVRVIRQKNQGESVARNRGMDEAQGEWVALLDADDRWLPNKLERQVAALREGPDDVVCVYSDLVTFGSEQRRVSVPMWPVEWECRVRMLTTPWIYPCTALILKSMTDEVKFPVSIVRGEDQIFWMQLYKFGTFIHVPEPLAEYRKHANQQTAQEDHGYYHIFEIWDWVKKHPESLSAKETQLLRRLFTELLILRHDQAFWRNDIDTVKRARVLYSELALETSPLPPLFEREPAATWTMRAAYHMWNAALDILPLRLRQGLIRVSRGLVESLKRGMK